jgi:erythromycin esterase
MQTTAVAARQTLDYLKRVSPGTAEPLEALLAPLLDRQAPAKWAELGEPQRVAVRDGLEDLLASFDREQSAWTARSSGREWGLGRHRVTLLSQAAAMYSEQRGGYGIRDEAMAANVRWILDTEPPGTKVVLWAHNGHISRSESFGVPMGWHLSRALGDDYVALGFAFDRGSFQAIDGTGGTSRGLREHTVGPAPAENVEAAFARAGAPISVLDLRRLEAGSAAARWFDAPHPMRQIGAVFSREAEMSRPIVLTREFDGILFVSATTRARPVGKPSE